MTKALIEKLEEVHAEYENDFRATGNRFSDAFANGIEQAIDIVKGYSEQVCNWRNRIHSDAWYRNDCGDYSSDCGLECNISNNDSLAENEMYFCSKCGRKLVEIQPPSEVQP